MKNFKNIFTLIVTVMLLLSCEKDKNSSNTLMGMWYNPSNYFEYIDFIDGKKANINGLEFEYRLNSDSIYFQYSGNLFILCYESAHKLEVDYNTEILKIENIDNICLISGNTGFTEYSRKIQPNDFIGRWINQDLTDTLYFSTNETFKRYYGFYNYTYTNDSLTIQYKGPEKIYVKPITIGYELEADTLVLNLKKDFYPDFKKGIRKYFNQ